MPVCAATDKGQRPEKECKKLYRSIKTRHAGAKIRIGQYRRERGAKRTSRDIKINTCNLYVVWYIFYDHLIYVTSDDGGRNSKGLTLLSV